MQILYVIQKLEWPLDEHGKKDGIPYTVWLQKQESDWVWTQDKEQAHVFTDSPDDVQIIEWLLKEFPHSIKTVRQPTSTTHHPDPSEYIEELERRKLW